MTETIGKSVLEVGSYDVNGSPRSVLIHYFAKSYLGVDIQMGKGVDEICDGAEVHRKYGECSFDVVICCEMLEHVKDWKAVVSSLKHVTREGGILIVTTRSLGFAYHPWPEDFWRFDLDIFRKAFADMTIAALETDYPPTEGVLFKAVKPKGFREIDLSGIEAIPTPR